MAHKSLLDRVAGLGRFGLNLLQAMGRSVIFL